MEKKEIIKGLMNIIYDNEEDYAFSNNSALNVANRLYKDLGKEQTERFTITYKQKPLIFELLIDTYLADLGDDYLKEANMGLTLPKRMEQLKYDFFSNIENDLKKDDYKIGKLLDRRLNKF